MHVNPLYVPQEEQALIFCVLQSHVVPRDVSSQLQCNCAHVHTRLVEYSKHLLCMSATKTGNRIINVNADKASPLISFQSYKRGHKQR